jgi:addiction module HigA family antidote
MLKRGLPPSHPGTLIRETIDGLKEKTGHNYTLGEIANGLGITRKTLSAILNERQGISSEMAVRLSEAFGTSAQFWLNVQRNYELWHAERLVSREKIKRFNSQAETELQAI